MNSPLDWYEEIWAVDFEFHPTSELRPNPVCMVAREYRSDRLLRCWMDELQNMARPPFRTDAGVLFVAYFASAELGSFKALGWKMPERILDLFPEFRARTNGQTVPAGNGLLGALTWYGFSSIGAGAKDFMRDLVLGGGPWDASDQKAILDYCQSDVDALCRLLSAMVPDLPENFGHALLRGRYMAAVVEMEWAGIPVDTATLQALQENWDGIKSGLVDEVDASFGVFDGLSFRRDRFARYLSDRNIPWPRTIQGKLALDDSTFRQMAKVHPEIALLRELRHTLSQLRLNNFKIGSDGRNRTLLSPFRSKTGRNQPSNAKFLFGASRWVRGLIKPKPDFGLAYIDWKSQEIGIAARLSEDENLWRAYSTGDPYLAFAIAAGLAPADATKQTHPNERNACKVIMLGVQYGMSAHGMASRAGIPIAYARELLQKHRETYRTFWTWSEAIANEGLAGATIHTRFGWPMRVGSDEKANPRSLMNFPMQANGAEMMRLATCEATETGLTICAPVHDALLLETPLDKLEENIASLRSIMGRASEYVLGGGYCCGVDAEIIRSPDRYMDDAGKAMWDRTMDALTRQEGQAL